MKKFWNVIQKIIDCFVPRFVGTLLILAFVLFGIGVFIVALQWVLRLLGVM